jgi:hypothetical protein
MDNNMTNFSVFARITAGMATSSYYTSVLPNRLKNSFILFGVDNWQQLPFPELFLSCLITPLGYGVFFMLLAEGIWRISKLFNKTRYSKNL